MPGPDLGVPPSRPSVPSSLVPALSPRSWTRPARMMGRICLKARAQCSTTSATMGRHPATLHSVFHGRGRRQRLPRRRAGPEGAPRRPFPPQGTAAPIIRVRQPPLPSSAATVFNRRRSDRDAVASLADRARRTPRAIAGLAFPASAVAPVYHLVTSRGRLALAHPRLTGPDTGPLRPHRTRLPYCILWGRLGCAAAPLPCFSPPSRCDRGRPGDGVSGYSPPCLGGDGVSVCSLEGLCFCSLEKGFAFAAFKGRCDVPRPAAERHWPRLVRHGGGPGGEGLGGREPAVEHHVVHPPHQPARAARGEAARAGSRSFDARGLRAEPAHPTRGGPSGA